MSELNWYWAYIPYLDTPEKQKESAISAGYGKVVFKSEADKVIARHKYKRCLAIASNCRLRARWFGDNAFYKKEKWALQWHRRWLELAEKFKEAKMGGTK